MLGESDKTSNSQWVIDKVQGKVIAETKFPPQFFGLFCLKFSPQGDVIISCFGQGAIQVRFSDNAELKRTIRSGGNHSFPVTAACFHPTYTDTVYTGSSCGNIFKCNVNSGGYERFAEEYKNEVNAIDICYDGLTVCSGGKDAKLRIYDLNIGTLKHTYAKPPITISSTSEQRFHRMRIFSTKFHPRMGDMIISGGWDDIVRIWDLRDQDGCVRRIRGPHICGDSIDIRDQIVLTGSWVVSKSLQLWDFGSGELIDTIEPINRPTSTNGEFLYTCQYYDDDPSDDLVVVGGSGTGYVEVISVKNKQVIGSYKVYKPCQSVDSFKNKIIFGGMENVIRIVDFNLA